jgi:glycolate oxidase iron-sulfur subunit
VKEYPLVLADADDRTRQLAKRVAAASLDVTELLDRNELVPVPDPGPLRIAYHDACHLAHAQSVRSAPRSLLKQIPNVTLLEIQDGHFCCGSAGLYNIQQPELASELGRRKAQKILEQKPDVVALGNIGCQVQIVRYLNELGSDIPVLHTLEILDRAYRGVNIASDGTSGEMRNDLN